MDIRNLVIIAHVDHGKTTLVDGMLPQGGDLGLYVKVRVTQTNFAAAMVGGRLVPRPVDSDTEPVEARAVVHFLFRRPTNYTTVWSFTGKDLVPKNADWVMAAHHDSAWRSDGFRILGEVAKNLLGLVTFEDAKEACLVESVHFARVMLVKVEDEPGDDPKFPRRRKVTRMSVP